MGGEKEGESSQVANHPVRPLIYLFFLRTTPTPPRTRTQVISAAVGEDKPVYVLQLGRAEAEAQYGMAMYNNRHPVRVFLGRG